AALPAMLTSTAAISVGDFTGDGKPDLFVGGRLEPRNYPYPARSYVLRNDGGRFTDVTDSVAPALAQPHGMITAAVWIDFDGDGRLDLVTAGEWMPLEFYRNEGARLRDVTASMGLGATRGRWYALAAGDFNHDGRPDLVAGNLGLNHTFTTSPTSTFGVYAGSFTGDRNTDILFTQRGAGRDYPIAGAAAIGQQIYTVAVQFPTFRAFSTASIDQMIPRGQLERALHYEADTFASLYLQNDGKGAFTASPLPSLAQVSPIRGIVVHDVDRDGSLDLIVAGNLYDTEPNTPRADAGNGLWLRGDGAGHFRPVPPVESGFLAPLDVTSLAQIQTPTGTAVLVVNHGDSLSAFTIRNRSR
ncbi:MAG TPA: VCBS repeat-containing protein, partial [Gemmatimonadales bacterium]|nr:VCBS repeat-containing protein [Gemmatimonadales bacterium]